jgi:hypothetical protein
MITLSVVDDTVFCSGQPCRHPQGDQRARVDLGTAVHDGPIAIDRLSSRDGKLSTIHSPYHYYWTN